ncbi:hypothetical protein [Acinetobacter indicus]|uniref:hypothetical protein n=1 Tax=Acinetobacter indicus TaxID=756892 RepID=UPI000CEC93F6|nr:hypothetical protein [Acinetobacter indicus]
MKKLLIFVALFAGSTYADTAERRISDLTKMLAGDSYTEQVDIEIPQMPSKAKYLSELEMCEFYANYAKQTMHERQSGGVIVDELKRIDGIGVKDPKTLKMLKSIVKAAYMEPTYSTESQKMLAVKKFQNDIYVLCMP